MPLKVKYAGISLIFSCISCLIAIYFEGLDYEELSFSDPFTSGFSVFWVLVIIWLLYDLSKKKNINLTLIIVSCIMVVSILIESFMFGFQIAHNFYVLELIFFMTSYFLLRTKEAKQWYDLSKAAQ
jgi:hypothetical protein